MSAVVVNGTPWDSPERATIADLVDQWCPSPRGIAVACNGAVVPKSRWTETRIDPGDRIEIVTAAAGG